MINERGAIVRLFLMMLISATLAASSELDTAVDSDARMISFDAPRKLLVLTGRWVSESGRPSAVVPRINTVRLECHRDLGSCTAFIAKLIQPSDAPGYALTRSKLWLMQETYRIVEWSESRLVARDESRAADFEVRVSFSDNVAELTMRETGVRGAEDAKADVVTRWLLK